MKIILLNQWHNVPDELKEKINADDNNLLSSSYYYKVLNSQHNIAIILQKLTRENYPIVVEGLHEDVTLDALITAAPDYISKMNNTFPHGMPKDYSKLAPDQKSIMLQLDSPFILLALGSIKTIYKSIHQEKSEEINLLIRSLSELSEEKLREYRQVLYDEREKEAIACAKEAAIKHFGTLDQATIIMTYGALHADNFKKRCEAEGIELEIMETLIVDPDLNKDAREEEEVDPSKRIADLRQAIEKNGRLTFGLIDLVSRMMGPIFLHTPLELPEDMFELKSTFAKEGIDADFSETVTEDLSSLFSLITRDITTLIDENSDEKQREGFYSLGRGFLTFMQNQINASVSQTNTTQETHDQTRKPGL